jgi:hypothetical protein
VFEWYYDANNRVALYFDPVNDDARLLWAGNGTSEIIVDADLTRFQEYEYAVTYDGTTLTLYRDGALIGSATPTAFANTPSILYVGENSSSGAQLNGWLDEFKMSTTTAATGLAQFVARKTIGPNATSVTKVYDADRRAFDILESNARLGDSSNNRWIIYMRGRTATQAVGREFVFEQASPAVA